VRNLVSVGNKRSQDRDNVEVNVIGRSETKTPMHQQMSPAIAMIDDEETINTLMTLDSFWWIFGIFDNGQDRPFV